jgi:hypothetical protein
MKRALLVALLSTIHGIRLYLPEKASMVAQEGRSSWSSFVVRRSSFVVRRSSFVVRRSSFVVRRSLCV